MTPSHELSRSKDWQQIRQRLARACEAVEHGERLSPERAQAILEERARLLARVPAQAPPAAAVTEVLIFSLGDERYALETIHIWEVTRPGDVTPLPGGPGHLVGVANLRGQILALFDLRRLFGLATPGASENSRIIVLGNERPEFGVLADAVFEVARLRTDTVLEPPGSVAGIAREYLRGVTEEALILLDGAVLLEDPRLFVDVAEDKKPVSQQAQP